MLPNRSRSSLSSLPSNPLDPFPKSNMSGESLTGQNNGRAYRDMAPQPNPQYQGQPSNGSAPVPPAPVKSKGKGRQSGDDKDEGGEKKRRRVQRACDVSYSYDQKVERGIERGSIGDGRRRKRKSDSRCPKFVPNRT